MDCNDRAFEQFDANQVSYGVAHPELDIKAEDCLREAFYKLALKVEYLLKNMCKEGSQTGSESVVQLGSVVDYSISPILTTKQGNVSNSIEVDWTKVQVADDDNLVQKEVNFYNSDGTLVASSSKVNYVIDFKPKDYPLNVEVSALVNTPDGTVRTSKVLKISADDQKTFSPILEVKKNAEIQDKNIALLNGEINKLKKLIDG